MSSPHATSPPFTIRPGRPRRPGGIGLGSGDAARHRPRLTVLSLPAGAAGQGTITLPTSIILGMGDMMRAAGVECPGGVMTLVGHHEEEGYRFKVTCPPKEGSPGSERVYRVVTKGEMADVRPW